MLIHLIGGRDCGTTIDTSDPAGWWWGPELEQLPLPDVLELHSHPANRAAYRMVTATPDEVTYQLDPDLTDAYRARR